MAVEAYLPAVGTVVVTAALDSINPCAIGVLIFMISILLSQTKYGIKRLLLLGSLYILTIFVIYLLAGLGLIYFFTSLPLVVTQYLSVGIGLLIVGAGLVEIKDYFWYGRWLSLDIPYKLSLKIDRYARNLTITGIIFLGAFVALVELPCTGAPYLAIITLLSLYFDVNAFGMLILYNIIFVAPLIIILLLVAGGVKIYRIQKWKQEHRRAIRLALGILLVAMGWLLMLIANGTINLG